TRRRPHPSRLALSQPLAELRVLLIRKAPLALSVGKALDAIHGVVGAHATPHGIGEDGAQESARSGCCRSAAGDTRQATLLCCLSFAGSLAFGHVVQEALNVIAGDGS